MRTTVIALALVSSPAMAQTNGDISWKANQLKTIVIDNICKPYTTSGQTDMLVVYVKERVRDEQQTVVATAICMAYTTGWTDHLLNRIREEEEGGRQAP